MGDETMKTPQSDFDALLSAAGDCGCYQLVTFLLIGAMQFVAVDAFAINFIAGAMDHRCLVGQRQNHTGSELQKLVDVPRDDEGFSRCYRYDADWDSGVMVDRLNASVSTNDSEAPVTTCDEWTYDQTQFTSTIVSQVRSTTPRLPCLYTVHISSQPVANCCEAVLIDRITGLARPSVCPSVPYRLITGKRQSVEKVSKMAARYVVTELTYF